MSEYILFLSSQNEGNNNSVAYKHHTLRNHLFAMLVYIELRNVEQFVLTRRCVTCLYGWSVSGAWIKF